MQTGGRKEPRFSSTHAFTLTGRSMVSQGHTLVSSALSKGARLCPATYWPPWLISILRVKGQSLSQDSLWPLSDFGLGNPPTLTSRSVRPTEPLATSGLSPTRVRVERPIQA